MAQDKYIGASARSKEAPRHVAGRGRYADDLVLPRMLHASILRSPYGHARISSVNASQATQLSGIVGIITPDDVKRRSRPFKPGRYAAGLQVPIPEYASAIDKVRYVGEPVAMVAAETRARAEDALERFLDHGLPRERITVSTDGGGCLPKRYLTRPLFHFQLLAPYPDCA